MVPIENCINDDAILRLLALCVYEPTSEKLTEVVARYDATQGWTLFGLHIDEAVVGVVGVRIITPGRAVIEHIAVAREAQRTGIGRQMIEYLVQAHQFEHLEAETDADAVEFYRRCGFAVQSLGEVHPGVERFRCVLESLAS